MEKMIIFESLPLLQSTLSDFFGRFSHIQIVGTPSKFDFLDQLLKTTQPDWLWVDGTVEEIGKKGYLKKVQKQFPALKIIVFSFGDTIVDIQRFYRLGIRGYLSKMAGLDELTRAMHIISENKIYVSASLVESLTSWVSTPAKFAKTAYYKLTTREQEVLQLIVDEYTTREIADKLFVSKCTIETHRLNLIQKLGVKNTAGLVRTAIVEQLCGYLT